MASARPMSDYVSCGVCMEQYDRTDHVPKLLPCQHTFCLACLLSMKRSSSRRPIECPICRAQHSGSPHDFITNRMAIDIAEELQQRTSLSMDVGSQQASPSLSCSAHAGTESVLVCVDCLTGICSTCVTKHKGHQLESMNDAKVLLRERFVNKKRKQQSDLQTEMTSATSVEEISRAEDDITVLCTLLISVITNWQSNQLSSIGKIKTKAVMREEDLKLQYAQIEDVLQNDIDISTLIRNLKQEDKISCSIHMGSPYNFVTARETILTDLTSVITSETNFMNSKFLNDQTSEATSQATSLCQSPQQNPACKIPAGTSAAREDNQGRKALRNIEQQQPTEPGNACKEKLQAVLCDKRSVPAYWTVNTIPWTLEALEAGTEDLLVDVDAQTYAAVEQLVMGSWVQQFVGQGAASVGLGDCNIQVQRVQRIEDPYTYQSYHTGLKHACQEGLKFDYPAITSIDNESEVLTATLNIPELEAIRLREVNEYFLFCGVSKDEMSDVVSGYKIPLRTGLFGKGLYLSESSTKADQHADDPTARARVGGPLYMVVYRAILGHIYHQKGWADYNCPPCREQGCRKNPCDQHDRYDSVMGTEEDGGVWLNLREFMIFNPKHFYPEFLVTYTRI